MFHIQLYTDSCSRHSDKITVSEGNLPRQGDVIVEDGGDHPKTYVVMDVTHFVNGDKLETTVHAQRSVRENRPYILEESGWLGSAHKYQSLGNESL
jgi:hypothetical protein